MPDASDRDAWDRAWASAPHRRLDRPAHLDLGPLAARGEPAAVTIAEDPPEYLDRAWRASSRCPICGARTSARARVAATLHPAWAEGFGVGIGVWAHRECLDALPPADGPAPVPW